MGKREKRSKGSIFVIGAVLLAVLGLIAAFPAGAQTATITVSLDHEGTQKADFTVHSDITITLTGNFTISTESALAVRVYFGILTPDGWETSISPEYETVTLGTRTVSFEGKVKPGSDAAQGEYTVYVWASVENPNPDPGDIMYPSSSVFSVPRSSRSSRTGLN